jgi:hypothetical protein
MSRPQNEVAAELAGVQVKVETGQLSLPAEALSPGETILDALQGNATLGPSVLVLTDLEVLWVEAKSKGFLAIITRAGLAV